MAVTEEKQGKKRNRDNSPQSKNERKRKKKKKKHKKEKKRRTDHPDRKPGDRDQDQRPHVNNLNDVERQDDYNQCSRPLVKSSAVSPDQSVKGHQDSIKRKGDSARRSKTKKRKKAKHRTEKKKMKHQPKSELVDRGQELQPHADTSNDIQQDQYDPTNPRPLTESSLLPSCQSVKGDGGSSGSLLLFYQDIEPPWSEAMYKKVLYQVERIATKSGVSGRMRVANGGFNCTLSTEGPRKMRQFCAALREWMPDVFCATKFTITNDLPYSKRFSDLKVIPTTELVKYSSRDLT